MRSSLLMPSFASSRATSPKSEFGATSKESFKQRSLFALVQLDRELADLGGEEDAVLLALGDRKAEEVGVVVGLPLKVGGLEGRVSDAFGFHHDCPLYVPADGRGPARAERPRLP